jgi:FkbM family methyltransferase
LKPADLRPLLDHNRVFVSSDWSHDISSQLADLGIDATDLSFSWDFHRWKHHFDHEILDADADKLDRAYALFGDDHSRRNFSDLLRYRLSFSSAFLRPAPFRTYAHPLVHVEAGDSVIDGGAWVGDSAVQFARNAGGPCRVYAFEPSSDAFAQLQDRISRADLQQIVYPIQKGVSERTAQVRFAADPGGGGRGMIQQGGSGLVQVTTIDDFCRESDVAPTLIKLDVEGSEVQALRGAQNVLSQGPKLQISVYHEPRDLYEIPIQIHEMNPNYEFYLEHHSQYLMDTTLYCRIRA